VIFSDGLLTAGTVLPCSADENIPNNIRHDWLRIPTKAATDSNLIAATTPV
jgi:hypothetical protein